MPSSRSLVELIPWDPRSEAHRKRLLQQRHQCGWDADKVDDKWAPTQIAGTKCLHWIAMSPDDPEINEKMDLHYSTYNEERDPLTDTADSLRGVAITPSGRQFHPIGHISLDTMNPGCENLDLGMDQDGLYWVKTLYVSRALQGKGIGRAAMDILETMAVRPPLNAKTIALDTLEKNDQVRPDILAALSRARPPLANQTWFENRGYDVVQIVDNFYDNSPPESITKTVFMRKRVT